MFPQPDILTFKLYVLAFFVFVPTSACWESPPTLNQSRKLACAVPADKKTAKKTAKKPRETTFEPWNFIHYIELFSLAKL